MNLALVASSHSRHNTSCQWPIQSVLADPTTCGLSQTKSRRDMVRLTKATAAFGLITFGIQVFGLNARGQAIAYMPVPGQALTGSTLGVTPVVSADRRYVRLSVNPSFNVLNGFSTFGIPGAVSGGPSVNAGMNGVIGPVGVDDGSGINSYGFVSNVGDMRAGPLPLNGETGAGNSRAQSDIVMQGPGPMMNGWSDGEFDQFQMWPLEVANRSAASGGQRGKSSAKSVARQRRAGRKAPTRPKTTSPAVQSAR